LQSPEYSIPQISLLRLLLVTNFFNLTLIHRCTKLTNSTLEGLGEVLPSLLSLQMLELNFLGYFPYLEIFLKPPSRCSQMTEDGMCVFTQGFEKLSSLKTLYLNFGA